MIKASIGSLLDTQSLQEDKGRYVCLPLHSSYPSKASFKKGYFKPKANCPFFFI